MSPRNHKATRKFKKLLPRIGLLIVISLARQSDLDQEANNLHVAGLMIRKSSPNTSVSDQQTILSDQTLRGEDACTRSSWLNRKPCDPTDLTE